MCRTAWGHRPHCPECGLPCEDDGDRYYGDCCFECGWVAPGRDAVNANNLRRVCAEKGTDVHSG